MFLGESDALRPWDGVVVSSDGSAADSRTVVEGQESLLLQPLTTKPSLKSAPGGRRVWDWAGTSNHYQLLTLYLELPY